MDTANYFSIAAADDRENVSASASGSGSGSCTPVTAGGVGEDKATKKARRIAEAVQRSKKEYSAENVYTERGVRPGSVRVRVLSEI